MVDGFLRGPIDDALKSILDRQICGKGKILTEPGFRSRGPGAFDCENRGQRPRIICRWQVAGLWRQFVPAPSPDYCPPLLGLEAVDPDINAVSAVVIAQRGVGLASVFTHQIARGLPPARRIKNITRRAQRIEQDRNVV